MNYLKESEKDQKDVIEAISVEKVRNYQTDDLLPDHRKRAPVKYAILLSVAIIFLMLAVTTLYMNIKTLNAVRSLKNCTICLDAGHGFSDPGSESDCLADGITEASINLEIVNKLAIELRNYGFNVVLTHTGNSIPTGFDINSDDIFNPGERVTYSDTLNPDIFISIHCDSFKEDENVRGTRIYYQSKFELPIDSYIPTVNSKIANVLADKTDLLDSNRRKCLIKPMQKNDSYTVISNREGVYSFLIECGFITNPDDAKLLADPDWQTNFASAIAKGLYELFG